MNSTYLKYLFKSKKNLCLVIVVLYILSFVLGIIANSEHISYLGGLISCSIVLGLLAFVVIPLVYGYVNNKKAVDSYFSLPVSRKETLITSQLFINIVIIVPFLVLSIASLIIGISTHSIFYTNAYLLYMLVAVVGVIAVTLFETSIFLEANSTFDGIVLMMAYTLMPLLILICIETFQDELIAGLRPINEVDIISYISLPLAIVGKEIELANVFTKTYDVVSSDVFTSLSLIVCILWHLVVSVIALRKHFINRKVERAETVSDSFFSYPFVIYTYAFIILFSLTISLYRDFELDSLIIYFIIFVCFMIATFVYRRKIAIRFKDVIFYLLSIAIAFGFTFIAYKTKGFGLSYAYDHNPTNYAMNYFCDRYDFLSKNYVDEYYEYDGWISKVYPQAYEYQLVIEGFVKEKDMAKAKDVIDIIENNREEAIEAQLQGKYEYYPYSYLEIITNYDETKINGNGFNQRINYKGSSNDAHYDYSPAFTKEEINQLSKFFDVKFTVYLNDATHDYEVITLQELEKAAKNK